MSAITRRQLIAASALSLPLAGLTACAGSSDAAVKEPAKFRDKTIVFSMVPGWDEGIAAVYLWKEILQIRGYTVEVQSLEVEQAYAAVATGAADIYLDAWLPSTSAAAYQGNAQDLETIVEWSPGASNVLAVPDYLTEINSIADLPAHITQFKGQIVGIEETSGLMRLTQEITIPQYGLQDFSLTSGISSAMLSTLDSTVKAREPIVVTLWQPHWAFARYSLKALTDPLEAYGKPDTITAVATAGFSKQHPEVAAWLEKFRMTTEQVAALELLIQDQGVGRNAEQEAARKWITDNQSLVDSWGN